jgi:general secretion pathway protein A
MFEPFFQLAENPFSMSPDPRFLMATALHREAIAGLIYGVTERKGFMVLTGEAGTGKTTILRAVAEALPDTVQFSYMLNPAMSPGELLEHTLLDLGLDSVPKSKARRMFRLGDLLSERHREGKVSALIVDEAHKLTPEVLEEIRLLTNFETNTEKMLQIVLVGQPELGELLQLPALRQLKQRIALRFKVTPLPPDEVPHYVEHRWTKAGGQGQPPFSGGALEMIKQYSQGIPRLINAICENSLLAAFAAGSHEIGTAHVESVARNLDLSTEGARESKPPEIEHDQVEVAGTGEMPNLDRDAVKKSEGKQWFKRLSVAR